MVRFVNLAPYLAIPTSACATMYESNRRAVYETPLITKTTSVLLCFHTRWRAYWRLNGVHALGRFILY